MTLKELLKKQKILKLKIQKTTIQLKKVTRKEKLKQIKLRNEERRLRARILLKFGIIIEITSLNDYSKNILLGHLFNFSKLNPIEKSNFKNIGEKLFKELSTFDKEKTQVLTTIERKKRNHNLIAFGALFEIANILNNDIATLIGYCLSFYTKDQFYINDCEIKGKIYFLKKEEK